VSTKVYEAYRIREGHDPFSVFWEIQARGRENIRAKLRKLFDDVVAGTSHAEHLKNVEQDRLFKAWIKEKYGDDPEAEVPVFREKGTWQREHCPPELQRIAGTYAVDNDEVYEVGRRTKKVGSGETPNMFDVDGWAKMKYGEQLPRYEKDLWALDVSVTTHVLDGRHYLIPYCERSSLVGGALDFMKEMRALEDFSYWNNTDPDEDVTEEEWEARGNVWSYFTAENRWTNYLVLEVLSWGTWSETSPLLSIAMGGANP
jgi:hypothetical protein